MSNRKVKEHHKSKKQQIGKGFLGHIITNISSGCQRGTNMQQVLHIFYSQFCEEGYKFFLEAKAAKNPCEINSNYQSRILKRQYRRLRGTLQMPLIIHLKKALNNDNHQTFIFIPSWTQYRFRSPAKQPNLRILHHPRWFATRTIYKQDKQLRWSTLQEAIHEMVNKIKSWIQKRCLVVHQCVPPPPTTLYKIINHPYGIRSKLFGGQKPKSC